MQQLHGVAGANGGKKQAFHVVAPSLPGYGFSSAPTKPGFGVNQIAATFDELMVKLGYTSYVAQGAHAKKKLFLRLSSQTGTKLSLQPIFLQVAHEDMLAKPCKVRVTDVTRNLIALPSIATSVMGVDVGIRGGLLRVSERLRVDC